MYENPGGATPPPPAAMSISYTNHWRSVKFWVRRGGQIGKIIVTLFWWAFSVTYWW